MAEEGHELEGNAPCTQPPPLKIRSKIEILETQILLRKIEEMKQDAAHRSARNNHPRDLEHHSAVEIEEERGAMARLKIRSEIEFWKSKFCSENRRVEAALQHTAQKEIIIPGC